MRVTFRKGKQGRTCTWEAVRPPRTKVPGTTMAAGADVPHDLATFVIEEALGIEHGFWGCVAEGATFRSLGRRRTQPGRAVIHRRRAELDAAETRVNQAYAAWRAGEDTSVGRALDEMRDRWRGLGEDDVIVLEWVSPRSRDRRRRTRSHLARD